MWCIVLHCGAVWCTVVQCELLIVEARETYMYEQKRPICMNKRDLYVWTKETYIHEQYAWTAERLLRDHLFVQASEAEVWCSVVQCVAV